MPAPSLVPLAPGSHDGDIRGKFPDGREKNKAPLLLLVNLEATRVTPRLVRAVRGALSDRFAVETVSTAARGDAAALCRAAAPTVQAVAVLGGDGTLNEAANGLAGGQVPLACLPGGLTNVFARELGGPLDPLASAERLAARELRPRAVDLGSAGGRCFLFASGLGLSGALTRRHASASRRTPAVAQAGAIWAAGRAIVEELGQRPRLRVTTSRGAAEGTSVVVQNADRLTFVGRHPLRVCERGGLSTRTLSLAVLGGAGARELVTLVPRVLSGRAGWVAAHRRVASLPAIACARVEALDGATVPLDVDGEYLGEHASIDYVVLPAALRVLG